MTAPQMPRQVVALLCALWACRAGEPAARVGAEEALIATGAVEALRASYEVTLHRRLEIVPGSAAQIRGWIEAGEVDAAILVGERALAPLRCAGHVVDAVPLAKEALVFIGPSHMAQRQDGAADPVKLLADVAKSGHRYLKARPGSVERSAHDQLFKETACHEPGSFVDAPLDGPGLVEATRTKAIALVRRSALVTASAEAPIKGWVLLSDRSELAAVVLGYEVPAACTHRSDSGFVALAKGELGRAVLGSAGPASARPIFELWEVDPDR